MNLFKLGVDEQYPEYLQRKIVISNQVGLIIGLFVALPFLFLSLIYFPPLAYLPGIAIPFALSTLFFNYIRLHNVARILIGLLPICLAAVYEAYLSDKGQAVTPGLAMIMLSFSFLIFILFDLREKTLLVVVSAIVLCIMLSMDWLNGVLEMKLETEVIKTGFLAKLTVLISIICGGGSILILAFQNSIAEGRAAELLKEAESNHKEMLVKEQELKENLAKLEEAQKEEKKRQWTNEGLTRVMTLIRDQHNFSKLCDELISFIVKYMNANQGGLFLVNEENKEDIHLELKAAYAYERKKYLEKRVEIGNGLLGQAYLEKSYIYLKSIPQDYINITSGLGTASPTSVLLVPLKINDEIPGVIELASFHEFAEHEIRFMESIAESIASAIQGIKVNTRTRELLESSQQQAEEMRSQEEEMRQNMEELNATQEEMSRKEREYLQRIAELEQTRSVKV